MNNRPDQCLYVFLDEAGDFNFSPTGTQYFVLTSLTKRRPFEAYKPLTELKYDLIELGVGLEYFHASEDQQATRNRVFDIVAEHLVEVRLDSLIVEKRKVAPLRRPAVPFYPEMLGWLLKRVLSDVSLSGVKETIIVTDRIPVERKRQAVEKAVKETLVSVLPEGVRHRILHHESRSNVDLQIADYCNWAVYRKWDRQDQRSYARIQQAIASESAIYERDTTCYY